jgi:hypothetical protein
MENDRQDSESCFGNQQPEAHADYNGEGASYPKGNAGNGDRQHSNHQAGDPEISKKGWQLCALTQCSLDLL